MDVTEFNGVSIVFVVTKCVAKFSTLTGCSARNVVAAIVGKAISKMRDTPLMPSAPTVFHTQTHHDKG